MKLEENIHNLCALELCLTKLTQFKQHKTTLKLKYDTTLVYALQQFVCKLPTKQKLFKFQ